MWPRASRQENGSRRPRPGLVRLLWLAPLLGLLLAGTRVAVPALAAQLNVTITGPTSVQTGTIAAFAATVAGQSGGCTPTSNTTYNWTFSDTGSTTTQAPSVGHTFNQPGTVTLILIVNDNCGDSPGSATSTITVGGGGSTGSCTPTSGNPITVSISPNSTTIAPNTTVPLAAGVSVAAGTATFSWNFGDSTSLGTSNPVTHQYANSGTFTVTLTVTDSSGRVGCGTATVTVTGGGGSQTCSTNIRVAPNGPYTGTVNQAVNFGGFAQTFNGGATITTYTWSFGDNSTGSGQNTTHTYTVAGTYTVTLTATDSTSQSCSATTTATITGGSSGGGTTGSGTVTANGVTASTGGPYTGGSGSPVTFNATASTTNQGATIVSCVWSFGDNSTSAPCANATHIYNSNGTFTAALTVTDSTGVVVSASTTVTISGGSRTVPLVAGCNNVTSTFPDNTATTTLANGISPQATLLSVWKLSDPTTGRYKGFFPGATQASDLPTVNRLDAIFVCVNGNATLTEPTA